MKTIKKTLADRVWNIFKKYPTRVFFSEEIHQILSKTNEKTWLPSICATVSNLCRDVIIEKRGWIPGPHGRVVLSYQLRGDT